jgi:hypothetical protein
MQASNGGRAHDLTGVTPTSTTHRGHELPSLSFPGPRTGAAIWTAPCCMVGPGPKSNQLNHKMCNAAKYKDLAGQCAHQVSDTVFMFGGIGLMESVVRANSDYCLVDQPGRYVRSAGQQSASWVQSNSSKSWLAALDWALYETLCDLWQTDAANRWVLLGACASGLRSPINDFVPQSFTVHAVNPVPFPDALALTGAYKASAWSDDVGNLWLFGGYMGDPDPKTSGIGKAVSREFSPGGTLCSHELWAYDPMQGGSWSHVHPAKSREPTTRYLPTDAGNLPTFNWPQLGKCGAVAWRPWYRPLYHDSGDPQVCHCRTLCALARRSMFFCEYRCMRFCWLVHHRLWEHIMSTY